MASSLWIDEYDLERGSIEAEVEADTQAKMVSSIRGGLAEKDHPSQAYDSLLMPGAKRLLEQVREGDSSNAPRRSRVKLSRKQREEESNHECSCDEKEELSDESSSEEEESVENDEGDDGEHGPVRRRKMRCKKQTKRSSKTSREVAGSRSILVYPWKSST